MSVDVGRYMYQRAQIVNPKRAYAKSRLECLHCINSLFSEREELLTERQGRTLWMYTCYICGSVLTFDRQLEKFVSHDTEYSS
jgi:hypothetical protein